MLKKKCKTADSGKLLAPVPMDQLVSHAYMQKMANSTSNIVSIIKDTRRENRREARQAKEQRTMMELYRLNLEIKMQIDELFQLERQLGSQGRLMGVMVNSKGKCVGGISRKGKIHRKKPIKEPVDIIMNKSKYQVNLANILKQHKFHNSTVEQLLESAKKEQKI